MGNNGYVPNQENIQARLIGLFTTIKQNFVIFGHYKNANAGALGAFYAPNENVMFYVGQSFGSAKVTNASVNFKVGKTTNVKRDELQQLKERVEMLENLLSK